MGYYLVRKSTHRDPVSVVIHAVARYFAKFPKDTMPVKVVKSRTGLVIEGTSGMVFTPWL